MGINSGRRTSASFRSTLHNFSFEIGSDFIKVLSTLLKVVEDALIRFNLLPKNQFSLYYGCFIHT